MQNNYTRIGSFDGASIFLGSTIMRDDNGEIIPEFYIDGILFIVGSGYMFTDAHLMCYGKF